MPEIGERFVGTVVKTTPFGAFVSLTPGKDGLLHISQIRRLVGGKRVENVEDVLGVGDKVQVELAEIDQRGKLSLHAVLTDEQLAAEAEGEASRKASREGGSRREAKDEDGEALREDVFAFGIDLDGQLSPPVADGRAISAPDSEVLVDDSLKAKGLAVGDALRLLGSDHDWTIVGFTHDTTFQAAPVVTMDSRALRQHGPTSLSPAVSAVVFTSDLTTDSKATQSAKDAGLTILTTEELIRTLPGYSAQVLTFSLMIGSLIIITSTVLGIFIYVLTLQKRPVLGILKARGVPTGYLIRSGCAQTLVLSVVGIGVGLLLTMATSLVLPRAVPFRISAPLDLLIVTAFIAISVIGGFISVRVISRIDPVEAIS